VLYVVGGDARTKDEDAGTTLIQAVPLEDPNVPMFCVDATEAKGRPLT
jgi:hypothetical protein